MKKTSSAKFFKKKLKHLGPPVWFLTGFSIAALTLISIFIIYFQYTYKSQVIPGIFVDNLYVGEKTQSEVQQIYNEKNATIGQSQISFTFEEQTVTISAQDLEIGYDTNLIAEQAVTLGKSSNLFSNYFIIINSYLNGTNLNSSYTFNEEKLATVLLPIEETIIIEPVDALFAVEGNRVASFQESIDGRDIDSETIEEMILARLPRIISGEITSVSLEIPTVVVKPQVTTEEANSYGVVEKIGEGKSYFRGSIINRIFNIELGARRLNGVLVPPGEEFSFNENIGDISRLTGYKEAYIISGGRTILGDGGGVCQVSTTLFRAILDSGLPVTERNAHSYRVSYYEQQSSVGLDATIYVPSVDLKFLNDTETHILVQAYFNREEQSLTFSLFGQSDGRETLVSDPVVLNRTAAPAPLYQDDPSLQKGITKQIDFASPGATVVYTRTVTKGGETLIDEKYTSRYTPWQAVYLVGTKEG